MFQKKMRTNETISEIYEIKKWKEKKSLKYETNKYIYGFQHLKR